MKRSHIVILLIAAVLLLDQWLKVYIKLNFDYNQDFQMFGLSWARLHFVENEGMAFGITFGWEYGKLILSLFRIIMVGGLIWYLLQLVRSLAPKGLIASISLITAGAIGNIIDSAFYGILFTESPYHGGLAQFATADAPAYGTFLHGKVVDMLYFPMKYIHFPDWMPFWSGEDVLFFSPIFNIADAAISCGVFSILLFQRGYFKENPPEETTTPENEPSNFDQNQVVILDTDPLQVVDNTDDLDIMSEPNAQQPDPNDSDSHSVTNPV